MRVARVEEQRGTSAETEVDVSAHGRAGWSGKGVG